MSAISFEIKLDRVNKVYQAGEIVTGKLCFNTKTEIKHEGINLWLEGSANLQTTSKNVGLLETFSNTVKTINIINQTIELPKINRISAGKSEIPFSVPLKPKVNKVLYDTYHGVFIMIQYQIKCEIRRSILNANLQRIVEVIIENKTTKLDESNDNSITFTITPNEFDESHNIDIQRQFDNVKCKLDEPLTGRLVIQNSNTAIRSIELQLTRIERIETNVLEDQFTVDATEVQRIQVADGNILRNTFIPLYMLFPRLFSCSTLITNEFKIEFELVLIVAFEGNFVVNQRFPVELIRN